MVDVRGLILTHKVGIRLSVSTAISWGYMTEQEMAMWLHDIAPTDEERTKAIIDMLEHANEDDMSQDDRVVCNEALLRLVGG